MKLIKALIITLLFTGATVAQECNATLFMKKGTILEYTNYDKKGKDLGKATHETLSMKDEGDKLTAEIQVKTQGQKKGEDFTMDYLAYCENGLISIDMSRFFDNAKLAQYDTDDITIKVDGNVLKFPLNMSEGDKLNDGNIIIKVNKDDFTIVTMIMDVTDRMVHANETITTDAGTFDCQKVSFNFVSKFGILKIRGSGTEWYNEDKFIVKSESYNKKGKLLGSTELTKISN